MLTIFNSQMFYYTINFFYSRLGVKIFVVPKRIWSHLKIWFRDRILWIFLQQSAKQLQSLVHMGLYIINEFWNSIGIQLPMFLTQVFQVHGVSKMNTGCFTHLECFFLGKLICAVPIRLNEALDREL